MKSVKPGRGPSAMGGFASVIAGIFGIFWTVLAVSMGAPFPFPLFGVLFILLAVVQAVYHFRNAAGKNRNSIVDITDAEEEPDPLDLRFGSSPGPAPSGSPKPVSGTLLHFCPYCGQALEEDFAYCPGCGKKLPQTTEGSAL